MESIALRPVMISCKAVLAGAPGEIAAQILDVAKWPGFQGWGILPGIKSAVFEVRTPSVVGSRIRVTNRDGSTHVEEIIEWNPDRRVRLRMTEFSPPLSRLASEFEETWEFEPAGDDVRVIRSFRMFPRFAITRPLLWAVSCLLKKAVVRHLQQMREASRDEAKPS
jgi:hypothetical protein